MKSKLHRSITALMAFLILFSSTGFALVEHQCMMRGKSVQLLATKKADSEKKVGSCCAKRKAQTESKGTFFKKAACCKESHTFEKLDIVTAASHSAAKVIKAWPADIVWFNTSYLFLRAQWILPSAPDFSELSSFSSRLHGKRMLIFIQSFLI
ncbi:hypothetical protein [Dyadobacter sp. CY343]|uniref:hypothetical protein n=1 Tax=Dyadobacter sp. CY343 TaxID=2907299 RepID=UPI001F2BCC9B|nr:hypothetical protein [Dyadobacter sp. CY343]MCE7061609.1 hypothetical protein [Dyadobacter sp. CY343]